jgi:hypothetical protein
MKYKEIFEQIINEINMSPAGLRSLVANINAQAGMEFEMIVPGASQGDDDYDDDYRETDYDADESVNSIQDAFDFFYDGDFNSRRDCEQLRDKMTEDYHEWLDQHLADRWETDKDEVIYDWLRYNAAPSDVFGILGVEEDENGNYPDPTKEDYRNAAAKVSEDQINPWYEEAEEDFRDNFYGSADLESEWLESADINTMQDVESNYHIVWPHYFTPERETGEVSIDDAADSFSRAIGKPINSSNNYHGARREPGHYVVEPDGSLEPDDDADGGLEFVSPPMPVNELIEDLKKVKAWADKTGCYTNDSTGLHINVSVPNWDGNIANLDFVKLAILMGDEYVLQEFGRQGNTYCKSALKMVKNHIVQRPDDTKALLDKMREHLNTSASKIIHSGSTSKYTSINTKTGYIEFRSPGGDWLNDNFDKIENTLYRFVVAMDAAVDETKYKQEYAKKLYKLLTGNESTGTDTLAYFARYAAGELPQSALKSFVRQAQLERKVQKDPTSGQKYWWSVGRPGFGASVQVVATSKEEAIQKGKSEYPDWANATNMTAKPIKPYDESPVKATVGEPQPAGSVGQSSEYELYRKADGRTVIGNSGRPIVFRANSPDDAANKIAGHLADLGLPGDPTDYDVRSVLSAPIPGSTLDLQRQRNDAQQGRAQTSPTHRWKIIDGLGRPLYVFFAANNTRAFANEFAALWARENNFDGNYQVEPVGENEPLPTFGRHEGGRFTGIWKLVDGTGRELYRLSGVGNNAEDAYRAAVPWIRNNGHEHTEGLRMVPVMVPVMSQE